MYLCFVATTPLIDCSPDDNACNVDANSQCNIEIGKCVCKPGFEVKKTICEGKSNRNVSENI
jgi:hypothetical protein